MVFDDLVIARVRLEPERERIAHHRNDADDFVHQNVERHPAEKNFRDTEPKRLNQRERGDERRAGISYSGNEADDWIEAETKIRPRNTDDFIHDEGEPFEKRFEALTFSLFLWRQNLPIDFL